MNGETHPPLADFEVVDLISTWGDSRFERVRRVSDGRLLVARTVQIGRASDHQLEAARCDIARVGEFGHPCLDRPLVVESGDGELRLVSDIWPGETLQGRMLRGRLAIDQALDVAVAVSSSLQVLHRQGMVHGGLLPAEVWLGSGGEVTILGSGLRHLRTAVSSGAVDPDIVAYQSPEQLIGGDIGPASDIWSVGVLLYEMVAGRRGFEGRDSAAVRMAVIHETLPPITGVRTGVAGELASFFARALDKDPGGRFASIEDARTCLRAVAELLTPMTEAHDESAHGPITPPGETVSMPLIVGQRIANFEILEELGSGGMGRVYRARDSRLGRSVALKFLPVHAQVKEQEQQFIQEAKAASALDHPNICTIYGADEAPDGETFIAMAYYDGPSLARRLDAGPLSVEETVAIGEQVASGLQAAHERGIVHCDIKPANIMLTRDNVAKIVDFGIAKIGAGSGASAGGMQGTMGYLSPEQVEGRSFDHRVDIWALGVVLYEMVAGERPFPGKDLKPLMAIVERDPAPLEELLPGIPKRFAGIVAKCLAKEPDSRYHSAAELVQDLGSLRAGEGELRAARRRKRMLGWGALAAAVLAGAALWFAVSRADLSQRKRGLALVGFRAQTDHGENPWLTSSLEELLRFELAGCPDLRVVRPSRQELEAQLDGADAWAAADGSVLARVAAAADTHHAVAGSFAMVTGEEGNELEVTLKVHSGGPARLPQMVSVRGPPTELLELTADLATRLTRVLGFELAAPPAAAAQAWPQLDNAEATQAYLDAVARIRRLDGPGAQVLLERVVELEPGDAASRILLVEALLNQGQEGLAQEQVREAAVRAAVLPRPSRVLTHARDLSTRREHERAAALYTALWRAGVVPAVRGELPADAAVRLCTSLVQAGRAEEAIEVLETVVTDDPRMDLVRCEALHWLNRYAAMLDAAQRAVGGAEHLREPLLLARARRLEATAYWRIGAADEGLAAAAVAAEIYAREDHLKGQADAAVTSGILHFAKGDLWQAKTSYDRAAALYRSLGHRRAEARTLTNKALVLEQQGDLDASIEVTGRALELFRQSGDTVAELITLVNLTDSLVARGRFDEARAAFDEAFARVEEVKRFEPWTRYRYSDFMVVTGDLSAATANLRQGLRIQQQTGDRLGAAESTWRLGAVQLLQGEVGEACRLFETAVPILERRGTPVSLASALRGHAAALRARGDAAAAEERMRRAFDVQASAAAGTSQSITVLGLARLALERGDLVAAEARAREALTDFDLRQMVLEQAAARELMARIHHRRGSTERALEEAREGLALLATLEVPSLRLRTIVTEQRIRLASSPESAREILQAMLPEVTELGMVELELEIRLALAEAELAAGHLHAGRARLEGVVAEARIKSFGEIMSRAQGVLDSVSEAANSSL